MPRAVFTVTGDIKEFDRVDNIYRALKREGEKGLENWEISVDVTYGEKQGEKK